MSIFRIYWPAAGFIWEFSCIMPLGDGDVIEIQRCIDIKRRHAKRTA